MTICTSGGGASEAYAEFAPFYDRYVEHPGYAGWIQRLLQTARDAGFRGGPVLDVGCGTGLSTEPLVAAGLDVTACEPVAEMAAMAEDRLGPQVPVLRHDVTALPVLGSHALITMLNDVVNHLAGPEDLGAAMGGLARNLAPGGLVVLDANTVTTYRTVFATTAVREEPDVVFVWRGACDEGFAPGGLATAELDTFVRDDGACWRRLCAHHAQHHHPRDAIEQALRAAGLRTLLVYGQDGEGVRRPGVPDELRDRKLVYVAAKP
jgi:SAM-dependent methyltransferase